MYVFRLNDVLSYLLFYTATFIYITWVSAEYSVCAFGSIVYRKYYRIVGVPGVQLASSRSLKTTPNAISLLMRIAVTASLVVRALVF